MEYFKRVGHSRRSLAAIAAAVVVVAGTVTGIHIWAHANSRAMLTGSVLPELAHSQRLGPEPASSRLTVSVILAVPGATEQELLRQPRKRLTPSAGEAAAVSTYLAGQGLAVAPTGSMSAMVEASGTASQLEAIFGTKISRWLEHSTGTTFYANDSTVTLDSSVASDVVGVAGLDDYPLLRPEQSTQTFLRGIYSPVQLRDAYGITTLANSLACGSTGSGEVCNGSGQSVGLFAVGGFNPQDIVTYDGQGAFTGAPFLPWPAPFQVHVEPPEQAFIPWLFPTAVSTCSATEPACGPPPSHNLLNGSSEAIEQEAELDIEAVQSMAPGSGINVYEAQNMGFEDFAWFLGEELRPGHDNVLSISYAGCESSESTAQLQGLGLLFLEVASDGESVFAGSGDYGKYCAWDPTAGYISGVSYPASAVGVTAVGGTTPLIGGDGTYQDEAAWDEGGTAPQLASGGGVSLTLGTKVPEVAAPAHFEVFAYVDQTDSWQALVGTSVASPLWAAFAADFNEYAQARSITFMANRTTLGWANAWFSWLAMQHNTLTPFFDVTMNNDVGGSQNLYGPAAKGWDYATGWGSYNADNLALDLVPSVQVTAQADAGGAEVTFAGWPYLPGDTVIFGVDLDGPNYAPSTVLCRAMVSSVGAAGCSAQYDVSGRSLLGAHLTVAALEVDTPGISTVETVTVTAGKSSVPVVACPIPGDELGGQPAGTVPADITLPNSVALPAGMSVYATAVPNEGVVYTFGPQGDPCSPGYGAADGGFSVSIAGHGGGGTLGVETGIFATYSSGGAVAGSQEVCPYFAAAFAAEQRLSGDADQACVVGGMAAPVFDSPQVQEQLIPTGVTNVYMAVVRFPAGTLSGGTEPTDAVVEANIGDAGGGGEVVYCTLGTQLASDCAATLAYAVETQFAQGGSIGQAAAASAADVVRAFVS